MKKITILMLLFSGLVIASDFDEAVKAFNDGDFKAAYKIFSELAENKDANAQCELGLMHYNGKGIKKDFKQAFYWFKKAAYKGSVKAQYYMGVMYSRGKKGSKNYKN